jgi:hypothetical protein
MSDLSEEQILAEVKEETGLVRQCTHIFHTKTFNLKKLNKVERLKSSIVLKVGNCQSKKQKLQPEISYLITNRRNISHGLMKDAQKYWDQMKQSKLKWSEDPDIINADNLNINK